MKLRIKSMIWNIRNQKTTNQNNKKKKEYPLPKNDDSICSHWDHFKCSHICTIGMPEGEEKQQEIANVLEKIMKENFSNLVKEIDMQVQEAQLVPKRSTPRYIIIKMLKVKDTERGRTKMVV